MKGKGNTRMQTAKTEYKRSYGLTVEQLAERIMQREDNIYYRMESIRDVIYKFCDECVKALENGEKINLTGLGTLTPSIHAPVTMNIFDAEDEKRIPYVTVQYRRSTKLKNSMNNKYRKNIENGFAGLSEHCICDTRQRNTLIEKGLLKVEGENTDGD